MPLTAYASYDWSPRESPQWQLFKDCVSVDRQKCTNESRLVYRGMAPHTKSEHVQRWISKVLAARQRLRTKGFRVATGLVARGCRHSDMQLHLDSPRKTYIQTPESPKVWVTLQGLDLGETGGFWGGLPLLVMSASVKSSV